VKLAVLVLEDEPPVRDALERDLAPFGATVRIEVAEDVADAWAVIDELDADGDRLALVLADHRLPGASGVDFLVELLADQRTRAARKVLVTGQADQADTIRAVNEAGLDHYVAKPWDPDELRHVVRTELTEHVLEHRLDPLPHLAALDAARVMVLLRDRGDR
jgi:response regulator RpfG family c-di-GMP phosphodiesterase